MATSIITSEINDPTGGSIANIKVVARLLPRPCYETATGIELSAAIQTTTDASGQWSLTLIETASITPSDSVYEIIEYLPDRLGGPVKTKIQVGANNASLYASMVSTPVASDTDVFLTQAAGDARYVQSPGTLATVGNISESRPADASAAGVLNTYARGDHKHDREQVSGTAAARAALSGTDLYAGLRFLETDTSKVKVYTGSAWVTIAYLGAWDTYTPTLAQGSSTNITKTIHRASYRQLGLEVTLHLDLAATAAGQVGTAITITLPVTAATPGVGMIHGQTGCYIKIAGTQYSGTVVIEAGALTQLKFIRTDVSVTNYMGIDPSAALASGDSIGLSFSYLAAAAA